MQQMTMMRDSYIKLQYYSFNNEKYNKQHYILTN